MRTLSDIQQRILKEEFPNMSLDSDTDIERYFELRALGRQADALAVYNNRLRQKYPDEEQRKLLMGYYRSRDPRFGEIFRDSLVVLAERIIARTTYIISFLTRDIDSVDMNDAYSVIKLVESLLAVISPDRYVAIAFTEKYVRYAKKLDFKHAAMERAAELIRLYVTDTIESVQVLIKEKEEKRKQHVRTQYQRKKQQATFDLSSITFSAADIERICVPGSITRTEDIVISYCVKYWNMIGDPAFEKTVFLFSRKYKTRNNDIFQAIKNGRTHNWKDEEILNAVLSNVVTGYYYNISGDLYIQREWTHVKGAVQNQTPLYETNALPPPVHKPRPTRMKKPASSPAEKKTKAAKPVKAVIPFKNRVSERHYAKPELPRAPSMTPNSIADMIKKMTGKTYTVYKDLFFQSIRPSIRCTLSSSKYRKGTLFDNKQNATEDIVYTFMFAHYNDPYQNWKESSEFTQVTEMGYRIPEIEPIIAHWIKDNH